MVLGRLGLIFDRAPRTDQGDRIYAIGDVHGRLDLLRLLLDKLEDHSQSLPPSRSIHVILLGDLIDRGPESAEVLDFVHRIQSSNKRLIVLKGNHEELMLKALDGYPGMLRAWMKTGGEQTLRSYGIDPAELGDNPLQAANVIANVIPRSIVNWVRSMPLTARSGDYLFCHAGVRPGVPIKKQAASDLLWIREEFLRHTGDFGAVVVHGHSITSKVEMHQNRIGVDTGAYRSGILTALYLENGEREFISVEIPQAGLAPPAILPKSDTVPSVRHEA